MPFKQSLATMFFKVIQYGYETIQNAAPILHSVICSEINTASIKNKRLLSKERGSYKFMFSLETVTLYCKKNLQLTISYWENISSH